MTDDVFRIDTSSEGARTLKEYWTRGEGAAKVRWGTDGAFARCVRALRDKVRDPEGLCAEYHKAATGEWPAEKGVESSLLASMETSTLRGYGMLAPTDRPTGDRRMFAPESLTHRPLPLPLMLQVETDSGHNGSIIVGRIVSFEEKEDGYWGNIEFLDPGVIPEVVRAVYLLQQKVVRPSVDLDGTYTYEMRPHPGRDEETLVYFTEGCVIGATLVAKPAFAETFISVSSDEDYALCAAAGVHFAVNSNEWKSMGVAAREDVFNADEAITRLAEWSGGAPDKFRKGFLYRDDSMDATMREAYRLPIADVVNGKLVLIPRAVWSAAAILSGAHGGLPNVSDPEKEELRRVVTEIYAYLADQYGDSRVRPPWQRGGRQGAEDAGMSLELPPGAVEFTMDNPDEYPGAMVALMPDEETATRLAVKGGLPSEELHLTLAYLGEAKDLDWIGHTTALKAASTVAAEGGAVGLEVFGVAVLNPNSEDTCAVYLVGGPGGSSLDRCAQIARAMCTTEQGHHYPFLAHVTGAYKPTQAQIDFMLKNVGPITVDRVRVAFGAKAVDIPLKDLSAPSLPSFVEDGETFAEDQPYGDVPYADPGYQADGQKRYPIDTEKHIRAAWSYINQGKNAGEYTPEQLKKVKERIKAAAKKMGVAIADAEASLTAAVGTRPPAAWFLNPQLSAPTALSVTNEGRVYGHLAPWHVCHMGIGDRCVMAPHSATDYAYYRVGTVVCSDGSSVRVGKITLGTGHADPTWGVVPAREHYDNTGSTVAVVNVGEDQHGIWVAGALVAGVTPERVAELRRSPLSGDWRRVGGNLELIGALAVNSPGFPVVRSFDLDGAEDLVLLAGGIFLGRRDPAGVLATVDATLARDRAQDRASRLARVMGVS